VFADSALRQYALVTGGYWAFTLTDGAIRMLVVFYFHQLGYSPFEVALLFLFYEFFGIVTNLVGGWLGSRIGLNRTMQIGMALQVLALLALSVPDSLLSVVYVMAMQALSGIAKDLNKMSAKASVKSLTKNAEGQLFKWVAVLTGSKNALKGVGFFLGAGLLQWVGFRPALWLLAALLFAVLIGTGLFLQHGIGKLKNKAKFSQVFSQIPAINWLSAARFFLFGARDVWFVVAVPVFLVEVLDWSFSAVGVFMACWVIAYGFVQASAPKLLKGQQGVKAALFWGAVLSLIPASIALFINSSANPAWILIPGLMVFGAVFAVNSALHSYLILAYSDHDKVSLNVGFYYMANAGGRLAGTVLSGLVYQTQGLSGCLWWSSAMLLLALLLSLKLPVLAQQSSP